MFKLSEMALKASERLADLDIKVMKSDIARCDRKIAELEKEWMEVKKIRQQRIKEYTEELNKRGLGIEEILTA